MKSSSFNPRNPPSGNAGSGALVAKAESRARGSAVGRERAWKSVCVAFTLFLPLVPARAAEVLPTLIRMLGDSGDARVQLDLLRGLRDALQGRTTLPMPMGWEDAERRLTRSDHPEIRSLATTVGLTFGSPVARESLRSILRDGSAAPSERQDALRALLGVRDATLPATLGILLRDPVLRGAAARGLATFDDPETAPALLAAYASLAGGERRDALNTLASRPAYARALLEAVGANTVPPRDLTAEVVRQLRNLRDEAVNAALGRVYGTIRDVPADKQAEIERYKRIYRAGGSTPGDAIRGRTAYAKVCQQCHVLFDVGGKVGPDLTGSNRGDLDYLLQNIVDPNAVIPNEYRAATIELRDGRVVTGIVKQQDDRSILVSTANETVRLARAEISELSESQLSMMPEGLVAPLADQEFRDLIYYLGRPGQSPLLATPETANLFFDGIDLASWQGDGATWKIVSGEIVAETAVVGAANRYLRSDLVAGDFRIVLEYRVGFAALGPAVTFRSEPTPDGGTKGYAVELGAEAPGSITEDGGRGLLSRPAGPVSIRSHDWNRLEVLALGSRVRAALNGKIVADLDDPTGARQGIIALRLPASNRAANVRFRGLRLEANPKPLLTSLAE